MSVKDKFTIGMTKTVHQLYQQTKEEDRKKGIASSTQTDEEDIVKVEKKVHLKPGEKWQGLLMKERKFT
jgi:hypothetical protein